ncbi:MAG TPA: TetR/AcrR family transcriptional regulator [Nocardioidaceae bacterium]|nr:TetR/AcrR family transcriptional regulator [Nocardioidaceae bacterium]
MPAEDEQPDDRTERPARPGAAARRRERSAEILAATRALFDARGVRDGRIEDIAKAVGINRAIIYRHFSGKEELFALTLVGYLDELVEELRAADTPDGSPTERLRAISTAFLDFGERYPAFVDCALSLLRRPGDELMREVNEGAMLQLGRSLARCLHMLVVVIEAGVETGEFHVDNPDLLANVLYTQALGGLQLARLRLLVREADPDVPVVATLSADEVKRYLVAAGIAVATRGAP